MKYRSSITVNDKPPIYNYFETEADAINFNKFYEAEMLRLSSLYPLWELRRSYNVEPAPRETEACNS